MTQKGTRITYRSEGRNPNGDNRINLQIVPEIKYKADLRKQFGNEDVFFIEVSDFDLYGVDKLIFRRKTFLLLEPNPVIFYFSIAFDVVPQFKETKNEFDKLLRSNKPDKIYLETIFSVIFRVASIAVIFSFLAIEAFMNQELPDYIKFEFRNKKVTKEYIQRWATFDEKFLDIIPRITKKDFNKKYSRQSANLRKYKIIRDELVHLKQQRKPFAAYDKIYQDILNINLNELISTTRKYINFYRPNTIINFDLDDYIHH